MLDGVCEQTIVHQDIVKKVKKNHQKNKII